MTDTDNTNAHDLAVGQQTQNLLSHLPVLVWVVNRAGKVVHVEGKALTVFGGSEQSWIGQTAASLFDDSKAKLRGISQALKGIHSSDTSQVHGRWFETHYSPWFDANGVIEGVSGLSIDVSERQELSQQLGNIAKGVSAETGEPFFKALTFHLAQVLDVDMVFVGRLSDEGDAIITCAVYADGQESENFTYLLADTPCENVLDTGMCTYPDNVHRTFARDRDLTEKNIRGYVGAPLCDSSGAVLGIMVVLSRRPLEDVSRVENLLTIFSSRAAAELQRERDDRQLMMISQVVEQGPAAVVITDAEGVIEYVNPSFTERMGYRLGDLRGQTPRAIKSGQTPADVYRDMWATIKSGEVWKGVLVNRARDGREVVENQTIAPIKDETGCVTHYVAMKEDLSQLHHSEASLRRINNMLTMLSECNQALVRSVSEKQLLESVIQMIARLGEYELVWFGVREADAMKPLMVAGSRAEAMATIHCDPEMIRCSNRARETRNCNSLVLPDDEGAAMPASLQAEQIRSAIVLPVVHVEQDIEGSLWILSGLEQAFDPQLRKLLEELAEDLAFGLSMLRTRQALKESEAQFRSLADDSMVGVYMIQNGRFVYANPEMHRVFGYDCGEIVGEKTVRELVAPEDRQRVEQNLSRRMQGEVNSIHYDFVGLRKDGARVMVDVYGARTKYQGEASVVGTLLDITERSETQTQLELMQRAISAAGEGIAIADMTQPDLPVVYVNPAFEMITGYTLDEMKGKDARHLLGDDVDVSALEKVRQALKKGKSATVEMRGYHRNGSLFWCELSVAPVRNSDRRVTHYIAVIGDISERKNHEHQLEKLSNYDLLTGLANKALMRDRLAQSLIQAKRRGQVVSLLMIDLDRFRMLTQSVGVAVTDQVLKRVGQRLEAVTRQGDTVARLESDNYAIVLSDLASIDDVAPKAREVMEAVSRAMDLGTLSVNLTCSIGVAVSPQDGDDVQALIRNAEAALFKAMEEKNTFSFYTSALNSTAHQRLSLEGELRQACARNEFELFYQPKVALKNSRVIGVEALIRWNHPTRGLVSPVEFIPIAEDSGMITEIGAWALEEACNAMVRINSGNSMNLSVAVNLSARQFNDTHLCQRIETVLQQSGLDPRLLELELTESMLMHEPEQALSILDKIKELGPTVALDDFGTGYSSLAYLKRFPIDTLKIDRSFILDIAEDSQDRAITRAVIVLAETLGLTVVAEGIESEYQREFLVNEGCYSMQGFLFSRPIPEAELMVLLEAHRKH
ncbi:EAL domain-containing protein [Aestuariirhabdus sp. LZHN29]|uniref:EAL domain-containing protein n=1 Tax=Aestuariirhabdus sp. LZHN29 TaxID=3417462 RepID=UPI003CECA67F